MEYRKESEKFAFGFGSKKTAGTGNLSQTEAENTEMKKVVATVALAIGTKILKSAFKGKKQNKKRRK